MIASYAASYRDLWTRHWWWRSRARHVLRVIERLNQRDPIARILDVGCGDGLFFDDLERFGEVRGIEADASLLRDAGRRDRIEVARLGEARSLPVGGRFDLVLLLDVIEHIEDDAEALRSAVAAARSGGRLVVTVPAYQSLWSLHDVANGHFRRYDARGLRSLLVGTGLEVELLRPLFAWTVAPMLARRFLFPGTPAKVQGIGGSDLNYRVTIPPEPLNGLLYGWSCLEHAVGDVVAPPWGSSLIAVARRV